MTAIPLTPAAGGGMCITTAALEPADVIVTTGDATFSKIIRGATSSQVSHAMLYVGNGMIVEAVTDPGVRRVMLGKALSKATLGVAYRRAGLSIAKQMAIVASVSRHVGKKYDYSGAAGAGLRSNLVLCVVSGIAACSAAHAGALQSSKRFFCSELVLQAFKNAGAPLVGHAPGVSTPQDIVTAYGSGTLEYVGHLRA